MHHPITPGKHWRAQMGEAQKRIEQDDAATPQSPDGGVIARLRSQLKRLDPRDDQYKDVAKAISDEYAKLYPGEEPDNAR